MYLSRKHIPQNNSKYLQQQLGIRARHLLAGQSDNEESNAGNSGKSFRRQRDFSRKEKMRL